MATLNDIGLAEPSTITKRLAAAQIQRNSTETFQELMCIADPDSTTSSAIAKVVNGAAASTAWGLVVRDAAVPLVTSGSTQGSGSTSSTIVSSNANSAARVVAYAATSTAAGPIDCGFYSGGTLVWPVLLWADGGVPKDQMAVGYPSCLFVGSTGAPLEWRQASTAAVRLSITYWSGV